jgi:hypothetical protein
VGSGTNKPQPDGDTPQGQEGGRLRIDFSVPVSETLPIAQEPAEDPNQPSEPTQPTNEDPNQPSEPTQPTNEDPNQPSEPTQPTNEDPSQTPPSEEAAESNS